MDIKSPETGASIKRSIMDSTPSEGPPADLTQQIFQNTQIGTGIINKGGDRYYDDATLEKVDDESGEDDEE